MSTRSLAAFMPAASSHHSCVFVCVCMCVRACVRAEHSSQIDTTQDRDYIAVFCQCELLRSPLTVFMNRP